MERFEESSLQLPTVESVKATAVSDAETSSEAQCISHKANGETESSISSSVDIIQTANEDPVPSTKDPESPSIKDIVDDTITKETTTDEALSNVDNNNDVEMSVVTEVLVPEALDNETGKNADPDSADTTDPNPLNDEANSANEQETSNVINEDSVKNICEDTDIPIEETIVEINSMEVVSENVIFTTEILVEKNGTDMAESTANEITVSDNAADNSILSELGQNIELSEVLRSSDTNETTENNNCSVDRQEVFNKEELLDILEGNEPPAIQMSDIVEAKGSDGKLRESEIALQQLSRLQNKKKQKLLEKEKLKSKGRKSSEKATIKKIQKKTIDSDGDQEEDNIENKKKQKKTSEDDSKKKQKKSEKNEDGEKKDEKDNIVNVLVQDWDDDDPDGQTDSQTDAVSNDITVTVADKDDQSMQEGQPLTKEDETLDRRSVDSTTGEESLSKANKSSEEGQPQRRVGRVIKKKVIFDPDNPDTFTKGKTPVKSKESPVDKIEQVSKKIKTEHIIQRSTSKSPISKLQWKKPPPKNSKQNKRLSEVDKLLMDEGAVNMIYQLTPEALKGKKNMKTKAEFIKKIQSSTPDTKEMKFRERKKEGKCEDGEPKKISTGKQRPSMSSSVKSPMCEDFETHSADDSIIYRRHSSSSYSSSCMSPMRVNESDGSAAQTPARLSRQPSNGQNENRLNEESQAADMFMSNISADIINKDDCLSIKEKLNSKLSLAFSKRKRESTKTDKPAKQRKSTKSEDNDSSIKHEKLDEFKYLSVSFDQRLAEICIRKTGNKCSIETIKELENALDLINKKSHITVTLLTSGCGTLCSGLDLSPLLDDNIERRTNKAYEVAESVRSLICCLRRHNKLLCAGVWGACTDVALVILALCDVTLASHTATFALAETQAMADVCAPLLPGVAVFTAQCTLYPQPFVNDLLVFGRQLSAADAFVGGLVSRTLWPERCAEQMRAIMQDIAAQPPQSILLKKKLLGLKKSGESESTFLSCLETERDLLIEYWTSVEGQDMIHATCKE